MCGCHTQSVINYIHCYTRISFILLGDSIADGNNDTVDTLADHLTTEHTATDTSRRREELEQEIASVELQLDEAVSSENYEEAGIL